MQDARENVRLNNNLCQIHRVLGNLREAGANLALERSVWMRDVLGQQSHRARIDHSLGQLGAVLADVAERGGSHALQLELCVLVADHQKWHGACVNDHLRQLLVVSCDVAQGPSCSLLHLGIKLVQTAHECLQSPRIHHILRKLRRVPGHRTQHEGSSPFVEAVLQRKGVDKLRQDLVGHHSHRELIAVVGQAPQGQCCRLLD
mmetsp:Transcript_41477/g.96140  ORF Transcript_41477/g.96140 Transcript_41477/m.96140 type:complete len:203 (-) Transcript_41477:222-830(-)